MSYSETTLFESPVLSFESAEHDIIQPGDFSYRYTVEYKELDAYRDEIKALVDAYDAFTWPDDRDEFANIQADYNEVVELLKALDYALNQFSNYEELLPDYEFEKWALERFYDCSEIPDYIIRYIDEEKVVRDMQHDFGMVDNIGYPFEHKADFYAV